MLVQIPIKTSLEHPLGQPRLFDSRFDPAYLNKCNCDIVWGGVEPLDGGHHAGVVNLAQEHHLQHHDYHVHCEHIIMMIEPKVIRS